ncbi:MAG: cation:proton antiporter family protein, partial [Patescibacteria group bacterium]
VALTFSSTIIILKLLSEKRDERSLYGRISIGFLLVQDVVAILILVFLTGLEGEGGVSLIHIIGTLIQGAVLFGAMLFLGQKILPMLLDKVSGSQELLFLISISWVFLMVGIVEKLGFSIEMGGFLAGLALANSSEHFQIAAKVKPLRDFFILIFFVTLGISLASFGIGEIGLPVLAFSLFVLFGNPLIVLIIMGLMGYRKRTSFLTGLTVAQISEFSLVLVALGARLGHIAPEIVALVTAVGVITITASTYFIIYGDTLYRYCSSLLSLFERKKLRERDLPGTEKKPLILIGCHRTGQSIAFNLPKKDLLILDFDPEVIEELRRHGFDYIFGDIADPDIAARVPFAEAKLVISTSPDQNDGLAILALLSRLPKDARPRVILRADDEREARLLYRKGADYVLLPHFTAGQYLGKTIAIDREMHILEQLREKDKELLRKVSSRV